MSGQGTVGLEIVDQLEEVDAVVVPVEGGTLLAGTCVAVKTLYPSIQMIVSIVFFIKSKLSSPVSTGQGGLFIIIISFVLI